ncbi:MAG: NADH-quinone oxidoreductase subunit A [Candidatus Bathyarchaeota archaeon]
MIYIGDHLAFWTFAAIEIGFLSFAIVAARLISAKKPNKIKETIYECGQDPIGAAKDYRLLGIVRYFGYAVVFFALDAFAWVVLMAAMSIDLSLQFVSIVSAYILVILIGVGYFVSELHKLVK